MSVEKVHHPAHYNSHPSGVEAIALCEHLGFNLGNALKYLWRCGLKVGEDDSDLAKARFYLSRCAAMPWSFGLVGNFDNVQFVCGTIARIVSAQPDSVLGCVLAEWLRAHDEEEEGRGDRSTPTAEAMARSNARVAQRLLVAFDAATSGEHRPTRTVLGTRSSE